MADLVMPSLGGGMVDGRLVEWLVEPGQEVRRGDVVAVVDTSKGAIEIEVFEDGVVQELVVEEGTKVPVGEPLARIRSAAAEPTEAEPPGAAQAAPAAPPEVGPTPTAPTPGEAAPGAGTPRGRISATPAARRRAEELGVDLAAVKPEDPGGVVLLADVERASGEGAAAKPAEAPTETPRAAPSGATEPTAHEHRVSPVARRVAEELGVDLERVIGTGPGGAVTRSDVERAAEGGPRSPSAGGPPLGGEAEGPPPTGDEEPSPAEGVSEMRRTIGVAMSRSKREIPHYYLGTSIDMSRALAWVDDRNAELPPARRILPAALLLKAVTLALRDVPELNGFWVDDDFRPGPGIHPGVAISLRGGGLVSPAIHDADGLSVDDLAAALRDLVQRARSGGLRGSEVADPTITVTALGERGVETVYGIINPPQVAIVGFGKIVERPWAEDGLVGARPVVHATLSADHRVTDGHRGGIFLAAVDELLQQPGEL